jgi:hypothetical protein
MIVTHVLTSMLEQKKVCPLSHGTVKSRTPQLNMAIKKFSFRMMRLAMTSALS